MCARVASVCLRCFLHHIGTKFNLCQLSRSIVSHVLLHRTLRDVRVVLLPTHDTEDAILNTTFHFDIYAILIHAIFLFMKENYFN